MLFICVYIIHILYIYLIYIYIYIYYQATRKNEILPFAMIWMNLEDIMLSEVSPTSKDKYHTIAIIWNLKKPNSDKYGRVITMD